MQILGINHVLKWVQIISSGRRYTYPTKVINSEVFFKFKNEGHKVLEYTTDFTGEFK